MSVMGKSLSSRECARLLKALAEEKRLQILNCLFRGERSVSEIAKELGENYSNVSHHIGILRNSGLLIDKKEGRFVVYQIHPLIKLKNSGYRNTLNFKCCSIEFQNNPNKKS